MALGLLTRVRGLRVEERHHKLYKGLGQLTKKFKINLNKGAEPFLLPVPRKNNERAMKNNQIWPTNPKAK